MKGKDLLSGMGFVEERFIHEAETELIKRTSRFGKWKRHASLAACFAVLAVLAGMILPDILNQPDTMPHNDMISDNDAEIEHNNNDNMEHTPSIDTGIHINMQNIAVNEIGTMLDAARRWYDPELYDEILWDNDAVLAYYGKDLTPSYIPDELIAANGNGTARIFAEKGGKVVEDMVWLGYFHDYYEDGSPKLTEDVAATKGFTILVSKIGIINDCFYIMPENEVKTSDIGGTSVTFGYRSMPYGPYDADTHEPSGYYDLYVAEFIHDEIEYQIVADQMEFEEVVKVVSSIIFGEQVILDR